MSVAVGVSRRVERYLQEVERRVIRNREGRRVLDWSRVRRRLGPELTLLDEAITGAKTILDAGCGYGWHACFLAWRGHAVTGVDLKVDVPFEISLRLGIDLSLHAGRIEDLPPAVRLRRFDLVLESFVLPVAGRRDIPRDSVQRQRDDAVMFLRAVRALVCRGRGTLVSLEGGRGIQSLRTHLGLLDQAGLRVEKISGPEWSAPQDGESARWLVECTPAAMPELGGVR